MAKLLRVVTVLLTLTMALVLLVRHAHAGEAQLYWQCVAPNSTHPTGGWCPAGTNYPIVTGSSASLTNPASTLTLPATTTGYSAGQLIANSATAASVVVPSFQIANTGGGVYITGLRLSTNDTTSTAWGAQTIQVDLWSAAPTFTNGDRGTFSPATGTANHLGSFSCTMSAEYGDGAYAECAPNVGNVRAPRLSGSNQIYWTLDAVSGSGTTGASKVFTLTAELSN